MARMLQSPASGPEIALKAFARRPEKKPRPVKRWLSGRRRWAAGRIGMGLRWLMGSRDPKAFGILMYHRVAPCSNGADAPTWNVTPERFAAQLAGLLERGFTPWSLRDALACRRAGQRAPSRAFVVTFDDGYENVHTWAWPILRELRIPATVFLATAFLDHDGPFPFDDWHLAGSSRAPTALWRPLTTDQCEQMRDSGLIELASHTHRHHVFWGRPKELHDDLLESRVFLGRRFGLCEAPFAFPFGIQSAEMVAAVRRAGLTCALTTRGELVRPDADPFTWGRFAAEQTDTASTLAAQLDGWCALAKPSWKRYAS